MMIKKLKDELKNLKSILNEIEKLKITRQLAMEQAYEISKELKELEIKIIDIWEELDENLCSLRLRNRYFWKRPCIIEKENKFKNVTKKKIGKLDRLETELKEKEELKYIEHHKNDELLSDLDYNKKDILHEILLKEIKLEKLGISEIAINAIKKSFTA